MHELIGLVHGDLPRGAAKKIKAAIRLLFKRHASLTRLHILWNIPKGGSASDGLALYRYFRKSALPITIYVDNAFSAGAIAVMGAKSLRIMHGAKIMVHPVSLGFEGGPPSIGDFARAFRIQRRHDRKVRAIVRYHLKHITPLQWAKFRSPCGITFGPEDLVALGLIEPDAITAILPKLNRESIWITGPISVPSI